ncbi:CPBP family intramembrane glutamic endopeptidase [Aquimarina algicola]|uniref:CPBP family intramembrane metalloprotease n=1 Tax=Aquimarina algicola TaxID=2589995 RepID=A0A504JRA7_9FLAO|nr:CPBP family intramembrane glutamic endopeptidase [Aquimarina algicola]TPN89271.1 CPBP family intramembrane metalloprotease [Aquimarina algicola]
MKVAKNRFLVVTLFIILLSILLYAREFLKQNLFDHGINSYVSGISFQIIFNVLLITLALLLIRKFKLKNLAGLGNLKYSNWLLLIFPLYLVVFNVFNLEDISSYTAFEFVLFLIYTLSIGFSEELLLRGFLQSYLIKNTSKTKKNIFIAVFVSSLIFGLLHLLNFNKGIYGELGQIGFATFIGVMFGTILLRTKNMYAIALLHACIDFAAKYDQIGVPFDLNKVVEESSLINTIAILIIVLPCLIYGIVLMRKYQFQTSVSKLN